MTEDAKVRFGSLLEEVENDPIESRELAAADLGLSAILAIRMAMKQSGVNQNQLASRMGVTESAVSQILNGDGNLKIHGFARYLRAMGFETDLTLKNVVGATAVSSISTTVADQSAISNPVIFADAITEFLEASNFDVIDGSSGLTEPQSEGSFEYSVITTSTCLPESSTVGFDPVTFSLASILHQDDFLQAA